MRCAPDQSTGPGALRCHLYDLHLCARSLSHVPYSARLRARVLRRCGEIDKPMNNPQATLGQCKVHTNHLLLIERGKVLTKGHVKVSVYLDTSTLGAFEGLDPAVLAKTLAMIAPESGAAEEEMELNTVEPAETEEMTVTTTAGAAGKATSNESPLAAPSTNPAEQPLENGGSTGMPASSDSTVTPALLSEAGSSSTSTSSTTTTIITTEPASTDNTTAIEDGAAADDTAGLLTSEELVTDAGIVHIGEVQLPQSATMNELKVCMCMHVCACVCMCVRGVSAAPAISRVVLLRGPAVLQSNPPIHAPTCVRAAPQAALRPVSTLADVLRAIPGAAPTLRLRELLGQRLGRILWGAGTATLKSEKVRRHTRVSLPEYLTAGAPYLPLFPTRGLHHIDLSLTLSLTHGMRHSPCSPCRCTTTSSFASLSCQGPSR